MLEKACSSMSIGYPEKVLVPCLNYWVDHLELMHKKLSKYLYQGALSSRLKELLLRTDFNFLFNFFQLRIERGRTSQCAYYNCDHGPIQLIIFQITLYLKI